MSLKQSFTGRYWRNMCWLYQYDKSFLGITFSLHVCINFYNMARLTQASTDLTLRILYHLISEECGIVLTVHFPQMTQSQLSYLQLFKPPARSGICILETMHNTLPMTTSTPRSWCSLLVTCPASASWRVWSPLSLRMSRLRVWRPCWDWWRPVCPRSPWLTSSLTWAGCWMWRSEWRVSTWGTPGWFSATKRTRRYSFRGQSDQGLSTTGDDVQ